jgi:hypothetical protein
VYAYLHECRFCEVEAVKKHLFLLAAFKHCISSHAHHLVSLSNSNSLIVPRRECYCATTIFYQQPPFAARRSFSAPSSALVRRRGTAPETTTFHIFSCLKPFATPNRTARSLPTMASIQRFLISVLLILSVTFVFFAQTSEASKGPKITHKVCIIDLDALGSEADEFVPTGLLRYHSRRRGAWSCSHRPLWQDGPQDCGELPVRYTLHTMVKRTSNWLPGL